MNDVEPTAKAWMDAVQAECPILPPISVATVALQRALLEIAIKEQELADFNQKVSDEASAFIRSLQLHEKTKQELADCKQELSDFKQKVSDAAKCTLLTLENDCHTEAVVIASNHLLDFIIHKPDPLLAALLELELSSDLQEGQHDAKWIRNKLGELGFEIREKNDV